MKNRTVMALVIAAAVDCARAADTYADVATGFPKLDASVRVRPDYEASVATQKGRFALRRNEQYNVTGSDQGGKIVTIGGLT